MEHAIDLDAIRERIRFICAQDQVQWHQSWAEILNAPSSTRRGLVHPSDFLQILEANGVFLSKFEARAIVQCFQAPNGVVVTPKFLQWIALSIPTDHVNPDLSFPRLPQPYRRIAKVLESDIIDAAWEQIVTFSARYKSEVTASGAVSARSVPGELTDPTIDDFQTAKKRCIKPANRTTIHSPAPHQVIAVASHVCSPIALIAVSEARNGDENSSDKIVLHAVHSNHTREDASEMVFSIEWWTPDGSTPTLGPGEVRAEIRLGGISSLQPLVDTIDDSGIATSFCLVVRLLRVVELEVAGEAASPTPASTTSTASQISMLLIETSNFGEIVECHRVAILNEIDSDPCAVVELSQDARFLAVISSARDISLYHMPSISHWRQQEWSKEASAASDGDQAPDIAPKPQVAPPIDMTGSSSTVLGNTAGVDLSHHAMVHFLVAPVTSSATLSGQQRYVEPPVTCALAVCLGKLVLKFPLPTEQTASITPSVKWELLSQISSSCVDASTQFLSVGCADGALIIWDVVRNRDHCYMSIKNDPAPIVRSGSAASYAIDQVMYQQDIVIVLSTRQQKVWFFDTRKRNAPVLLRTVSAPSTPSLSTQPPPSKTKLTAVVTSTSTLGLPIAIIMYSTGLATVHNIKTGVAYASVRLPQQPESGQDPSMAMSMAVNANAFFVVGTFDNDKHALPIDMYAWRQLMPSDDGIMAETREATAPNSQHLQLDLLDLVQRLAGKSKPSLTQPPPQPTTPLNEKKSTETQKLALQPLAPDFSARFKQFRDERADFQAMREAEAALLRRQRAILKAALAASTS